jgi:hypothetical protein
VRISHKHRFVFLANPRAGSTTIRNVLDDYSDIKSVHITNINEEHPFYNHITAKELKDIFDARGWDWFTYKRFCIVRNPFDRIVSAYYHQLRLIHEKDEAQGWLHNLLRKVSLKKKPELTFKNFVIYLNPKHILTITLKEFICDEKGNFLVDDVLMFEKLERDLPSYLKELGITISSEDIPHLNITKGRKPYMDYYDDETRKIIEDLYSYEIERFGYTFGN